MEQSRKAAFKGTKYLSFELAKEEYCIEIGRIKEILAIPEITPIPHTPGYMKGVMNLRGNILPVMDLRLKFDLPFREYSDRTCVVVVEIPGGDGVMLLGVVVDAIHEVLAIPDDKVTRLPYVNARIRSEYLQGFTETANRLRILLDINKVFAGNDMVAINRDEPILPAQGDAS